MADWVIRLIEDAGYLGVFLLMFLETVFPPVPSEVIMPIAGLSAARGHMTLWGVILSGTAGAMVGNFFWYLLARVIGIERFRPFIEKHGRWLTLDWYDVEKAERLFGRFGGWVVGLGRMMPTIRSVVSIPAGLLKMSFRRFMLASTLGTAGWTALLAGAGFKLGENYRDIDQFLGPASNAILVILVAGYIYRVWTHRHMPVGDEAAAKPDVTSL